ncbi:MAG: peptide ABC transporter substrate-binding protein [Gemmatimonadota bacterium]|nr:peptide ABC transporter substrate-binding protein [Gemmatimonadota bacterium]
MTLRLHRLLLVAFVVACGGSDTGNGGPPRTAGAGGGRTPYGGTLVIASAGEPDFLNPALTNSGLGYQVVDQLFDRLADLGDSINTLGDRGFVPVLADSWRWAPDSLSLSFHLNPRARWHDGKPVRARDVVFTYGVHVDPAVGSPVASLLGNIDSVRARDSLTAIFYFKRRTPEQFFDATYQLRIMPEHSFTGVAGGALKTAPATRTPIGSGRFRFARWVAGQRVEIVADTANYRGRAHLDRVIWSVVPDPTTELTKLLAGEADFVEYIPPPQLPRLAGQPRVRPLPYPSLDYSFIAFNLHDQSDPARPHPVLGDRALRRALTMAVNRAQLARAVLDTLGTVALCPCSRWQGIADSVVRQIPYDTAGANRLLDSLGWRRQQPGGIRRRHGVPLRISAIVGSTSTTRMAMAVPLQAMLRAAGVQLQIEPLESNLFGERLRARHFDAALIGWHADPVPSTVRQGWSVASARDKESSNFGGYESPMFDALVDSAAATSDPSTAKALYRKAYDVINDDAPAIWVYEPRNVAGIATRVHPVSMRADSWWARLPEWWIAEGERIPRDRMGTRIVEP